MKTNLQSIVAFAVFVAAAGLSGVLRAEPPEVLLKIYSKEFICFSDETESVGGSVSSETEKLLTPNSDQPAVSSVSVSLKNWPVGIRETPEARVQIQGITYIIPPRKIVVPGPKPKGNGVFVEGALDPNGSGDFEVLLIVNLPTKEFEQQGSAYPELDQESLPKGIRVSNHSTSSSFRGDQRVFTLTVILHNDTGQPFVLKPEHFKNLPETKDWPLVEVPPVRPQA